MAKVQKQKRFSPLYSKASKEQWKGVSKEERSRRMSELASKRWDKTPKKKRIAFAKKIRKAGL